MIKARAIAGDIQAGETFLKRLRPFVWRKHLDFAAIQDIHSIKRQIHAVKGHRDIAVAGHNIKLGRGGIREIEFFAQTQQLIWGGRNPELRQSSTCTAIEALVAAGRVKPETAAEMIEAYRFLRVIEHRLQMIDDRQTQTLPAAPAELEAFALFAGFDSDRGLQRDAAAPSRQCGGSLRRAVRGGAVPGRPRQSGVHRHGQRSGDGADAGTHGLLRRRFGVHGHPRLASWPLPGHAQHPGARAADGNHAAAAGRAVQDRQSRSRLRPVRRIPRPAAGGRAALLHALRQSGPAGSAGGDHGQRAAAGRASQPQRRPAGCGAGEGLLRCHAGPGSSARRSPHPARTGQ